MHQFGFTSYLSDHSLWARKTRCSAIVAQAAAATERLTLNYLSSAFLLLGAGTTLALLSFIAERVVFRWKKSMKALTAQPADTEYIK